MRANRTRLSLLGSRMAHLHLRKRSLRLHPRSLLFQQRQAAVRTRLAARLRKRRASTKSFSYQIAEAHAAPSAIKTPKFLIIGQCFELKQTLHFASLSAFLRRENRESVPI